MKKMLKIGMGAALAGVAFAGMVAVPASAADTGQVLGKFTYQNESQANGGHYAVTEPTGPGRALSAPAVYATQAEAEAASGDFLFPADGAWGPIQPASNPDLCLTYTTGYTPDLRESSWAACDGGANQQFQIKPGPADPGADYSDHDYIYNQLDRYVITTTSPNAKLGAGTENPSGYFTGSSTFVPVQQAAVTDITGASIKDNTATAINGTGEPGATITVSGPNGEIGTAVVADDGTWSVPSNITENTTVTATDGVTEDSFDVVFAADAPVDITGATSEGDTVTAINGKGEPGSTITVTDAAGTVIGTDVVDDNGNWSVPSNITENTTVTATDGVTEDSLDIVAAPIIAAPIALGALALGGVGFGGVMLRRRQKAGANA